LAFHGHTLTLNCVRCCHRATMDLDALIMANGADYLLRKIVDRAVCSKCGGVEISVTAGMADGPFLLCRPQPPAPYPACRARGSSGLLHRPQPEL
jgi:hypothetical protein